MGHDRDMNMTQTTETIDSRYVVGARPTYRNQFKEVEVHTWWVGQSVRIIDGPDALGDVLVARGRKETWIDPRHLKTV